jgi:hypothetical protein
MIVKTLRTMDKTTLSQIRMKNQRVVTTLSQMRMENQRVVAALALVVKDPSQEVEVEMVTSQIS